MTVHTVCLRPCQVVSTKMDLNIVISYPHPCPSLALIFFFKCLQSCSPSCYDLVVTSVSVFLPPSLPDTVLIKALIIGVHN